MASPLACALLALRTSYLRVGGLQSRPESESRRLTLGDVRAWQKCSSRTSREWRSLWRRRGRTKEVSIFKCEKLRCIYASLCSSEVTRALPLYRHTCSESSAKHQKDRKQKFSLDTHPVLLMKTQSPTLLSSRCLCGYLLRSFFSCISCF